MLTRSFCHIPGIGAKAESKLWQRGIHDWDRLHEEAPLLFKGERTALVRECLSASKAAYSRRDLHHFYRMMPRDQLWRLVPGFLDEVAYLDIETTGMGHPPLCHSTTITFYHRGEVLQEYDPRLKLRLIKKVLSECTILCTFFGESFDIPFLSREYGIRFEKAHLDLCHWLKRHGYRGGLKAIQKGFPEIPLRASLDIDGFDAVRLWGMHRNGVSGALETLLTYNAEDTIALAPLLAIAFNLEVERYPEHGLGKLEVPGLPELKTRVHHEVYHRLRGGARPSLAAVG